MFARRQTLLLTCFCCYFCVCPETHKPAFATILSSHLFSPGCLFGAANVFKRKRLCTEDLFLLLNVCADVTLHVQD